MRRVFGLVKGKVRKSLERDRSLERHVEALSMSLWPWREAWLLAFVGVVAVLDYASTYAFLELSGNPHAYEGGPLASWALQLGGFKHLFMVDMAALSALALAAIAIRFAYSKFGFKGFGRTAFVLLLVPYAVVALAIVFNNVVLTFMDPSPLGPLQMK